MRATAPRPARSRLLLRPLALGLGAAVAAAGAVAGGAAALPSTAATTGSGNPVCSLGLLPGLQNDLTSTDSGVAVYVGGDYVAHQAAAESEGRLVVAGSTTVDAGLLNLGRVGVGSGVVPTPGDVLVSAGDVTVSPGSRLDVNHGVPGGGDVRTGGVATGEIELNGGASRTRSADAATIAARAGADLDTASAAFSGLEPTGRLDTSGAYPTLVGDDVSDPQVFSLTTAEAATLDTLVLTHVGDARVVVNVSGDAGRLDTVHTAAGTVGDRIDDGAALGAWAPRIVWNFGRASTLELAGGSQLVGSILAPRADVRQGAHTNGRLWVGGDLDLGTGGSGLEHHNYPWSGECDTVPGEGTVTPPDETTTEGGEADGTETPAPTEPAPEETPSTEATRPEPAPSAGTPSGAAVDGPDASSPDVDVAADVVAGASTPSPEAARPEADDELPRTGAAVVMTAALGAALLGAGALLVVLRRRKPAVDAGA
ncbi:MULTISPECIES: choice-of-anchor A family protein [unclassified Isoptericola]|uniref:choice-of-anchor A family protein n=1 Tax=unclassified Isoptericola TaxID=2623355 RepID=UPI00365509E5